MCGNRENTLNFATIKFYRFKTSKAMPVTLFFLVIKNIKPKHKLRRPLRDRIVNVFLFFGSLSFKLQVILIDLYEVQGYNSNICR